MKKLFAVVLIAVACAIGQTAKAPQTAKQPRLGPQRRRTTSVVPDIFTLTPRADVYLLDTETGQIGGPLR